MFGYQLDLMQIGEPKLRKKNNNNKTYVIITYSIVCDLQYRHIHFAFDF